MYIVFVYVCAEWIFNFSWLYKYFICNLNMLPEKSIRVTAFWNRVTAFWNRVTAFWNRVTEIWNRVTEIWNRVTEICNTVATAFEPFFIRGVHYILGGNLPYHKKGIQYIIHIKYRYKERGEALMIILFFLTILVKSRKISLTFFSSQDFCFSSSFQDNLKNSLKIW